MRRCALPPRLAILPLLFGLTACWPGIPIALIAAAAGGGGGGGGGGPPRIVSIHGNIVTDPSAFANSLHSDREFNDRLGMSEGVGPVGRGHPAYLAGEAGTTMTIHALVDDASGRSVVGRELLSTGGTSFDARAAKDVTAVALARIDRELFLLDVGADGAAAAIRVTPLESSFVQRRYTLPRAITPAGMTALSDALLLLDEGNGTTRLVALDAADAKPLFATDLGAAGLRHLAGSEELVSGTPRLFTSRGGEILEVEIKQTGRDRRFAGVAPLFAPTGLSGGIAALGYDGVLVHVVDGAGTLHSYRTDGVEIATRSFVAAGSDVVSLVAHFDLGFDGYHFEVAAGERLTVDVDVPESDGATLFSFGLARGDLEQAQGGKPLFFTQLSSGRRHAEIDNTASATPLECDLAIGARAGAGRYGIALGDGLAVDPPKELPPPRDDDAKRLAAWLEPEVLAKLPAARLVEIYRDPQLPDFAPGQIVLGRADEARALEVASPAGFALTRRSRSPSGFDVWSHAADAGWQGPAVATLHGLAPKMSARREESRKTLAVLSRLAGAPGVAWREPVYRVHSLAGPVTPNDTQFQAQKWAFDEMHVRDAWNVTTGNANTVMAVVDTGIRTDNSDLAGAGTNYPLDGIDEGFDFITDVTNPGAGYGSEDGDGLDADPFDEGSFFGDDHHGSHVAGTIGTKGNNALGLCGINWDCRLMAVRALGTDGSGFTTDVAEGIRYAAQLDNSSGTKPADIAAVINLSLGLSSDSNAIHSAIQAAVAQGCIVCCAAGNQGNGNAVLFPAAYPESIAIAACDIGQNIATYSNTGPEIDVTGPGGGNTFTDSDGDGFVDEIWSDKGANQIVALAGTSMACAHASGVCGLLKATDPALTQSQALSLLDSTAQDLRTTGFDDYSGFGLIDANAALSGNFPPGVTSVTPSRMRYDQTLNVTISGSKFSFGTFIDVLFGPTAASNVVVVDDSTITCDVPAGEPGAVDLTVTNDFGSGVLAGGFVYTPATLIEGDPLLGATITIEYLCDAGDGMLTILGVPPIVTIPTPPYHGDLCIVPFSVFFYLPAWPFDEFDLNATIPNDPSLSGVQILLQALVGPSLTNKPKNGAWTNCAVIAIH